MNGLAKKVIVYSLIGCLQLGVGATAAEAATRPHDNGKRQEQRVSNSHQEGQRRLNEQRERERRQHGEQRRHNDRREHERWQHEEEMSRHHGHEDGHDDDKAIRNIGLGLILLAILANSGDDSGN